MVIDNIKQYKKLNQNGIPYKYKINDVVLYRDKLFTLISDSSAIELDPPTKKSKYWLETPLPNRVLVSTTIPVGLTFVGDRWFNPLTARTYTYIKNIKQYVWISY